MKMRNWFSFGSVRPNSQRNKTKRRLRLDVEALEDRSVPATISVAGATVSEVGTASAFVAVGSGGLSGPKDMVLGPDTNLYVVSSATNSVIRYNGATGQLIGTFVAANSGGLSGPYGLAFGPDGNLYVSSTATNAICKYSGATGAFLTTFVSAGLGGLSDPRGIAFGQDGNLYVSSRGTQSVLRYQGPAGPSPGSPLPAAGQSGATFVPSGSGGLAGPLDLVFGSNADLFVANGTPVPGTTNSNWGVLRFGGATGSYSATYTAPGANGVPDPRGLAFDPDGRLYVADVVNNTVHRFDSAGQYLDDLVANGSAGPFGLAVDAQGALLVSNRDANCVGRYDCGVVVTLSAASPTAVSIDYTTADGTASAGSDYTAQTGTVTFAPGQTSRRVLLVTRDDTTVEGNETFTVQLSNPSGGVTLAAGNTTVTITDDDAARQITISDATATEGDHAAHYRGAFVEGVSGHNFNGLTFYNGYLYTSPGPQTVAGIDRYDAATGAFVDHFIPAGRINGVRDKVFRDGFLYIGSEYTGEVLRFDATTGSFVDVFVPAGSGNISAPHGMVFGPDVTGDGVPELYVTGRESFNVVRFDGVTGQPRGSLDTSGAGALSYPEGITISPSGVVYVASSGSNKIQTYNAVTSAYLGAVTKPDLLGPKDVKFDSDGLMYVVGSGNSRILRFTASGTYVDDYVPAGSGGMSDPYRMAFGPDGDVYVTALGTNNQIYRFGTENEVVLTASMSTTSSLPVLVDYITANASALAGSDYSPTTGTLTIAPGFTSKTIRVPILDDAQAEGSETFTVTLTNATGATIADNQGVGAIFDATKFYVVNDAASDRTYEYGTTGLATENYALNSANSAPRGAASTVAGDKVWVVDANRTVYVYNASGSLLGSWSPGSMNASAQVEGIATNGSDIWIVDAKQDKVFRYSGAASRLSGSQNAFSSFSLNSGNANPKDLVTDATSIWVVNDSTTDKVFKYNLSGALLGSWTIDAANSSPTGITINPASVSDIWIVDNGTDKVYQYTNVANKTSGSQNAAASFALAPGNTNPQGIADPPAGMMMPQAPVVVAQAIHPESGAFGYAARPIMTALWGPIMSGGQGGGSLLPLPISQVEWSFLNEEVGSKASAKSDTTDKPWTPLRGTSRTAAASSEAADTAILDQVFADLV